MCKRHSGFLTLITMTHDTTSKATIQAIEDHFWYSGFPHYMRSDSTNNLDSKAMDSFRERHGIEKELSRAYFVESNGMSESQSFGFAVSFSDANNSPTKIAYVSNQYIPTQV